MGEEKPTNTSNAEEHIYLDVIHIASRPPSKRSLCPTADDSLQTPDAQDVTTRKKTSKESGNVASWVLIASVILLSALCCTLGGLYAIERRRSAMLQHENNKRATSPMLFTNCTTKVRPVPTPNDLDCAAIESGIKKAQALYSKKCVKRMGKIKDRGSQDHSINNTPTECVKKSLQFSSISDMVTSQSGMAMASATICFWCKKSPGVTHYIKYKEPNMGKGFEFFEEKSVQSPASTSWHSFCWTWSTDEEFNRSYKDGRLLTHKEINRERRMPGGGTWELGLRSDTLSGVKGRQHGEITSVNVWNRILRKNELTEIMTNCMSKYQGNVKSWQEFKTAAQGNVKLVKSDCCKT